MQGKEPVNHRRRRPRSKKSPSGLRFIGGLLLYTVKFSQIDYNMLLCEHLKQKWLLNHWGESECVHLDILSDFDSVFGVIFFSFHIYHGNLEGNESWLWHVSAILVRPSYLSMQLLFIRLIDLGSFCVLSFSILLVGLRGLDGRRHF